uniref:Secreted protein n=1 Tax=Oryza sativa subsp. japonica TaxID=39947 RepID=Q6YUM3_ORYSJ|nr:hypothetical protein [Oryza sativa Japonica Group]
MSLPLCLSFLLSSLPLLTDRAGVGGDARRGSGADDDGGRRIRFININMNVESARMTYIVKQRKYLLFSPNRCIYGF